MTFGDVLTQARRYARVSTLAVPDADGFNLVNDAIVDFAHDAHGLPGEEYLDIKAEFDLRTEQAFRLTVTGGNNDIAATDIAATDSDLNNQTGAQVATKLQSQIQAAGATDVTVSWNDASLYFTITDPNATAIIIAEPSGGQYVDATDRLFGTTGTQDGTWQSSIPEDSTIKADLPSDQVNIQHVEWDKHTLQYADERMTLSPEHHGDPYAYYVRGTEIYLYPPPNSRELFYIRYRYVPARTQNPLATTAIPTAIPTTYQHGLEYLVAAKLLYEQQEDDLGDRRYLMYKDVVNHYIADVANQNPSIEPHIEYPRIPRVIV